MTEIQEDSGWQGCLGVIFPYSRSYMGTIVISEMNNLYFLYMCMYVGMLVPIEG